MNDPMLGRAVAADEYGRIETFDVPSAVDVEFVTDELQALCPAVEGVQPDIYRATIRFTATTRSIESKSLKLYLTTFRERRIFAEHLAVEIADTIGERLGTDAVTVELVQNVRGGLVETVTARWSPPHPGAPTRS